MTSRPIILRRFTSKCHMIYTKPRILIQNYLRDIQICDHLLLAWSIYRYRTRRVQFHNVWRYALNYIQTYLPTNLPHDLPTNIPNDLPINIPTYQQTDLPYSQPTYPSLKNISTYQPTYLPKNLPTFLPTNVPT